jgi:hypothetical protein
MLLPVADWGAHWMAIEVEGQSQIGRARRWLPSLGNRWRELQALAAHAESLHLQKSAMI